MAGLIQIRNALMSYGDQVLLDDTEATIMPGVKLGLVGRNGAGKTTLLRILLGEEELEAGEVIRSTKLRAGYLRQHDPFQPGESALDFLMRDSDQPDWKCGEVAGRFEIKGDYLNGPVSALSGGWQTRVKLAALLLHEPNLLVLDEPTNFLDLRTQILLEHFLRGFSEACLIVSHDRAFLQATCTHTLDLTRGKLTLYPGPIEAFLQYQEERREHDLKVNATVAAKQRQLERFITKNRAKAATASQARSKSKQLERLQTVEIEGDEPNAFIRAPLVMNPRQGPAVRCLEVDIGYPNPDGADHVVARGIDLEVEHGQRTAIVGDNGQGKTTLLRTLVNSLATLAGTVKWGHGCTIGTYAQHVYTSLPQNYTVLEYLESMALKETAPQHILNMAGALLFKGKHVNKKIEVLSGGERARVCMAGLLLGDYNILVLDEPGNHLDVQTVEALMTALMEYKGTVLFTSHDRYFLERITTSVIEVRDGTAKHYTGGYDAYLYAVNKAIDDSEQQDRAAKPAKATRPRKAALQQATPSKEERIAARSNDRLARKEERRIRKEISTLESKIATLTQHKAELDKQLLNESDADEALRLHNEITDTTWRLAEAEDRWCTLQEELGQ